MEEITTQRLIDKIIALRLSELSESFETGNFNKLTNNFTQLDLNNFSYETEKINLIYHTVST